MSYIYCLGYGDAVKMPIYPPKGCKVVGDTLLAVSKYHINIDDAASAISSYVEKSCEALCAIRQQHLATMSVDNPAYTELMEEVMILKDHGVSDKLNEQLKPIVDRWHAVQHHSHPGVAVQLIEQLLSVASNYLKVNVGDIQYHSDQEQVQQRKKTSSHGKNLSAFYNKFCCRATLSMVHQVLEPLLDEYFRSRGMLVGSQIRGMDLNPNGITRGPYTITHLEQAVHELEYNKLYSETVMIAYWYWRWTPPILEPYDADIQQKHALLDQLYTKYKQDYDKKSSPNSKVVLYVLLTMLDYPYCHIYMHELITSEQTIHMYNDILGKIHKEAITIDKSWKEVYIPIDGICHTRRRVYDLPNTVIVLGGAISKC